MAQLEHAQPFNAFAQGRALRQDEDYANSRNKLAQIETDAAPERIRQENALSGLRVKGAQMDIDAATANTGYTKLKQALGSGNPREYVLRHEPALAQKVAELGVDLRSADDETVAEVLDGLAREYAGKAGIAPTPQLETLQGDGGSILQRDPATGALKQVVAPQRPDRFAETQAAADRRAQEAREHAANLAREQRAFTAEQNDLNRQHQTNLKSETANVKQKVLEQQNNRVYQVYKTGISGLTKGLEGTSTGPIAGRLPAVTSGQQIAEGGVAAMAPILKSLFRGAGEGTFTDKDQDLLIAMLPTRKDEEDARAAKLANIDAIVKAKLGIAPDEPAAPPGGAEITATGPNGQQLVLRNGQWVPK
jgi:hypothetical protein